MYIFSIFFDNENLHVFKYLVCSKSFLTFEALSPSLYARAFVKSSRIKHLALGITAKRTFHVISPNVYM